MSTVTIDPMEWMQRRAGLTDAQKRQQAAEHEAAHAIVARALGMDVGVVDIKVNRVGNTDVRLSSNSVEAAAVIAAPMVWFQVFRTQFYPSADETGCSGDRAKLLGMADGFTRNEAGKLAREVLRERGGEVLELARLLDQHGAVDFSTGRPVPCPTHTPAVDRSAGLERMSTALDTRRPSVQARVSRTTAPMFLARGWEEFASDSSDGGELLRRQVAEGQLLVR